jgi:integrase
VEGEAVAVPPKRTGSVEEMRRADGSVYFVARVRLADGTRERDRVPAKHATRTAKLTPREHAELYAEALQEREDETGERMKRKEAKERTRSKDGDGETVDHWFDRYLPTKECGENHRRISELSWRKWISPVIGDKAIRTLTRNDVEDVRDKLDVARDTGVLRHSTARNIWGTLTGALKAAANARDRALRVHETPLHFGMLPPKTGTARERPWLYPSEWAQLIACRRVADEALALYAIALYTGLRPGELRALLWGDVDLDARMISVSKAFDDSTGETKPPKTTAGRRKLPIHERLLPLLVAMRGDDADAVVAAEVVAGLPPMGDRLAEKFREHLHEAKVERPRLAADNETEEPIDFRSLRDTHATWLALSHVPDKVIQRRLGHKSPSTTDKYIKAAEAFGDAAIGAPFPPLPKRLFRRFGPIIGPSRHGSSGKLVARVGFEPTTFGL